MNIIPKATGVKQKDGFFRPAEKLFVRFEKAVEFDIDVFSYRTKGVEFLLSEEKSDINFVFDPSMQNEGYVLSVKENGVEIRSSSAGGAIYGFATFLQAFDGEKIPCMEISDAPRFAYRGIMLDVARHFFGKEVVKELLDEMAFFKLNVFHWHLTEDQGWRVEIKKYPELALNACKRNDEQLNPAGDMAGKPYGEGMYFTQDDVREIVEYASKRNITVIPEIDMPGHITSALSVFPELSCEGRPLEVSRTFGIKDTIGCVGNPAFIEFTHDVLDEICELFPAPYFHIGGDEVPKAKWKVCPKCQALMKEKGIKSEDELQGYFTNMTMEYLASKGKKTIGWNEILDSKELRSDAIVQWWKGNKPLDWLKKGGKAVLSKCTVCYMDYPYTQTNLQKIYSLGPEIFKVPADRVQNVLGIEAPLWTEFVYDKKKFDFLTYPRLQAVAEAAWTAPKLKCYKDFEKRLQSFLPDMERRGLNYCPPSKYNPVGLKGLRQRIYVAKNIRRYPDCEEEFK